MEKHYEPKFCPITKENCKYDACALFVADRWDTEKKSSTSDCSIKLFLMRGAK
jgi:hypothetical protein